MTTETPALETKGFVLRAAQARWYDLLATVLTLGRDRQLRERLAELAQLAPGETVLDVGCGTGTLALAAKRAVGASGTVMGIDASADMIALATHKAARADADVQFRNAVAERLPMPDATFDAVLATLMLHHLPASVRREFVGEALRVLKPGGRMLAVDFGAPSRARERPSADPSTALGMTTRRRGGVLARLHRHGGLPLDKVVALLREAGFDVKESGAVGMVDLQYALAVKPLTANVSSPVGGAPATRSLAPLRRPLWLAPAAVGVVVAAHLLMGQQLVANIRLTAAGLAIAVVAGVVVWLHLPASR